ncbi:molybdenum cofactor guanylyltransferase [Sporolactobacillus sp. THM7-7]|nr:molybdenum cofactor guanylyltransferase [Sporolactobacillus sp. THM7-7]
MNKEDLTGIVLAGGRSRRFGSPKALMTWRGKRFIFYSIQAIKPLVSQIIVVSHLPQLLQLKDVTVIEDAVPYKGNGPLAGIFTAMTTIRTPWYFVLPCDVPLITEKCVSTLIQFADGEENPEVIVPCVDGRAQPLIGLYHCNVKEKIECQLVKNQKSMRALLAGCKVQYMSVRSLSVEKESFLNINTKKDYKQLLLPEERERIESKKQVGTGEDEKSEH